MNLVEYVRVPLCYNWASIPDLKWTLMGDRSSAHVTDGEEIILLDLLKYVKIDEQFVQGRLYYLYRHCRKQVPSLLCRRVHLRVLRLTKVIHINQTISVHFANAFTGDELAVLRLDSSKGWTLVEVLPELWSALANGANMTFRVVGNVTEAPLRGNVKLWSPSWTCKERLHKVKPHNTQSQIDVFFKPVRKNLSK
jgi:hypothetical protein